MTRLPLAALLTSLVLAFAGCSNDTAPSAAPASDPTTTTTTTAPEPTSSAPPTAPTTDPTTDSAEPTKAPPATPTPSPSQTPVDPDAPPTSYAAAQARFDAHGSEPQALGRFRTDNGTYCLIDSGDTVGCELPRGGIPDPDYCGDGPSQNIGRIVFGTDGPTAECNSDTIREPGAPRASVGTVAESSTTSIRCLVEESDVLCVYPARRQGFFLSRDDYTVFTS